MAIAATALCSLKVELDRQVRPPLGQSFVDDWMDCSTGNTCAYHGGSFLHLVLPFMRWMNDADSPYFKAYVSPLHVLGASIKGLPEEVRDQEVERRIERYSTNFGSSDDVCYIWLRRLGLFYAHEGKHRVAFMRYHDQPAIAAWVREAAYPDPSRLKLVPPTDERDYWLAMLDDRYIQVLLRPQITRRLLDAYGVKTVRWSDLEGLPDERKIQRSIQELRLHRPPMANAENTRTLDLKELDNALRNADEVVVKAALDMAPFQLDWHLISAAFGTCFLGGLAAAAFEWEPLQVLGWTLIGAAHGLLGSLLAIRYRGARAWWSGSIGRNLLRR